MGFFTKRKSPPREAWLAIASELTGHLLEVREKWFALTLETLGEGEFEVVNDSPTRVAHNAVAAYQLEDCAAMLAKQGYVAQQDGRDFADILFGCVCGTELERTMEFFSRYQSAGGESQRALRLSRDVAAQLLGKDPPNPAAGMAVALRVPRLSFGTFYAVAESFGDHREMDRILKAFEKAVKDGNL